MSRPTRSISTAGIEIELAELVLEVDGDWSTAAQQQIERALSAELGRLAGQTGADELRRLARAVAQRPPRYVIDVPQASPEAVGVATARALFQTFTREAPEDRPQTNRQRSRRE